VEFDSIFLVETGIHGSRPYFCPRPVRVHALPRFSGITSLDKAIFDLEGIRKALDTLIGPETIMVGHSLESDFMMLRISHHPRVIDTIKVSGAATVGPTTVLMACGQLFPHERGLPYRRGLRALAHEYLRRSIQNGDGSVGHSSEEDAVATLDLVRHYVRWRQSIAPK
jgi:RNA exonuclease 1